MTPAWGEPRWYTETYYTNLIPPPPNLPHHPECPCCLLRRRLRWLQREVESMRGARIRDDLIRRELERQPISDRHIELLLKENS